MNIEHIHISALEENRKQLKEKIAANPDSQHLPRWKAWLSELEATLKRLVSIPSHKQEGKNKK